MYLTYQRAITFRNAHERKAAATMTEFLANAAGVCIGILLASGIRAWWRSR